MNESQIQEAIKVADIVVEFSNYLHKIDYNLNKWMQELHATMDHIKKGAAQKAKAV